MALHLGLDGLDPLDPAEIPSSRPKGYDSAKIVRELREQRSSLAGLPLSEHYYLDTSAIIKRYVSEQGSEKGD